MARPSNPNCRRSIPYSRQDISEDDIQAVTDVLRSDFLTQGPHLEQFEQALAEQCQVEHAVAVSSATAALHIACLALGIRDGDRVWTSPNTFVASANCALYCGAQINFVDIHPETRNMDPASYEEKLSLAKKQNRLPKLVIPVHFGGYPCEMKEIMELSNAYGVLLLEDASHALGAQYLNDPIGKCTYSSASIVSFHPVKMITTGEGGAILTQNAELAQKLRLLRTHGITRNEGDFLRKNQGPWYYEQQILGYNYRMTDIQAALGTSQLQRLSQFVHKRRELARRYQECLSDLPLRLPHEDSFESSSFHLFPIELLCENPEPKRAHLFHYLRERQIGVNVHYLPVHRQPYYANLGFKAGDFPCAERYSSSCISIPLYTSMTEEEQTYVIDTLRDGIAELKLDERT